MATLEELAKEYADTLRSSEDAAAEVKRIAREIDGLYYPSSGQRLPGHQKLRLVDMIRDQLLAEKTAADSGLVWILKEADNKKYLELVAALKKLL